MTIINDNSSIIIKWSFKFIDAARGVIYDRHMFIVQATHEPSHQDKSGARSFVSLDKLCPFVSIELGTNY
jgi:hypothetical protein